MKKSLPEPVAKKCAEICSSLRLGSSIEEEAEKLRGENLTSYTKSQIMYTLILCRLPDNDTPTALAFDFILDWRREILRDGLFSNVLIPDDDKMRGILSRPSWTESRLWETQGHEHRTDGLSLLERVYMVHEQLEADTPQTT